jgi:hypothetical protein
LSWTLLATDLDLLHLSHTHLQRHLSLDNKQSKLESKSFIMSQGGNPNGSIQEKGAYFTDPNVEAAITHIAED